MPIELTYESQEAIPEAHRELYTETDGVWSLTGVTGMKTEADVGNVQEALRKERELRSGFETTAKQLEGIDLEELKRKALEHDRSQVSKPADPAAGEDDFAKRIEFERKIWDEEKLQMEEKLALQEDSLKKFEKKLERQKIVDDVTAAAAKAGVRPEALPDVIGRATVFDVGAAGDVRTADGIEGVTPGRTASQWLATQLQSAPHWLAGSKGAGATGETAAGNAIGTGTMLDLVRSMSK